MARCPLSSHEDTDPVEVEVLVVLDVSKTEHHATASDMAGETLLSRTVRDDRRAWSARGTPRPNTARPRPLISPTRLPPPGCWATQRQAEDCLTPGV